MISVVDVLRQTSKGKLEYNREIGGQTLTNLLNKCASVPALSSPHKEITPPRPELNASIGLGSWDEEKASKTVLGDHTYSKRENRDPELEEKGEEDSLEQENPSLNVKKKSAQGLGQLSQNGSSEDTSLSPNSVASTKSLTQGFLGPKSPQHFSPVDQQTTSPKSPEVTSPKSWQATCPSPQSSKVTSPKSPEVTSPKSPKVKWNFNSSADCQLGEAENEMGKRTEEDKMAKDLILCFTERLKVVSNLEEGYDNRSREQLEKKHQEFLRHQSSLESWRSEVDSKVKQRYHQDISQLHESIEKEQQAKRPAMQQAVQKVKDNHKQISQRQDSRLRHLEQLGQQLQEDKARRNQELDQKLEEVKATVQMISGIKSTLITTLDQCPYKEHLAEGAEKTKLLVRRLSEQSEQLANTATRTGPLDEILVKLKQFHEQSMNALDFVSNMTVEAEKKAKAAEVERQKQQQAAAQSPQVPQLTPTGPQRSQAAFTLQTLPAGEEGAVIAVTKEYQHNASLLERTEAALDSFISNQQMKKIRFDLQRAVNTPVNAISPVSSAHLRDKLQRLHALLKGEGVEVVGKQVTATVVPEGLLFCKNLTAKMFVRKAEEQVSSNHESAFAIAAVAVGLWTDFPDVGELLMAHLQQLCPYIVPFYPPRLTSLSTEDYHKLLGYKIVDGAVEAQDKFLKRMSGILRLYAAILVTSPPQGSGGQVKLHPHGLEHAWVWLSRLMNLDPNPDITATAIYDMLQVTGAFLLRAYRVQFVKLLYFLQKDFLPKLKAIAAGSGPVIRLETFLETAMKNNAMIPEPEGYLSPRFWN